MSRPHASEPGHAPVHPRPLTPTWALMALALVATLALPDWADTGFARPLVVLVTPPLLGLAGAWVALRRDRPGWGLLSAAWGFLLVWGLFVLVTLVGGP